jgi:hypothetical protein
MFYSVLCVQVNKALNENTVIVSGCTFSATSPCTWYGSRVRDGNEFQNSVSTHYMRDTVETRL